MMKSGLATPDGIIDFGDIETLEGIDRSDDSTTISALTSYSAVADRDDTDLEEVAPVNVGSTSEIGDMQGRSRGTIGGNIAHSDPALDCTGVAFASDVTITAIGPDCERTIDVDDFF